MWKNIYSIFPEYKPHFRGPNNVAHRELIEVLRKALYWPGEEGPITFNVPLLYPDLVLDITKIFMNPQLPIVRFFLSYSFVLYQLLTFCFIV